MENTLVQYNVTDAFIQEMSNKFMALKLSGVGDKEGYEEIVKCRKVVKTVIKKVEEERVFKKADALALCREVDTEAKRIQALLAPIKDHCVEQENIVKNEEKRKKEEARVAAETLYRERVLSLIAAGALFNGSFYVYGSESVNDFIIQGYSEVMFESELDKIKAWKKAEDAIEAEETRKRVEEENRLAEVAEDQRLEKVRLDKVAAEQAEQARQIKEAQDKIDADIKAKEDEKRIEEAKEEARIEAEKKAVIKAVEDKIKHEKEIEETKQKAIDDEKAKAKLKIEEEEYAKEKAKKQAELLPDKEKLLKFSEHFKSIPILVLKSEEGAQIMNHVKLRLTEISAFIKDSADNL